MLQRFTKLKSIGTRGFRLQGILMTDQTHMQPQRRRPVSQRGRRQDASRDELIVAAALKLLNSVGYQALTMSDVASEAGVSKATLYRRWTTKSDLVADAVDTLSPFDRPRYTGASLRDDLLALMQQAGDCTARPDIVIATFEMARSSPDLYQTLSERFAVYMLEEFAFLAGRASENGGGQLSDDQVEIIADTAVALLAHEAGPTGKSISRERMITLVDNVLMVLLARTGVVVGAASPEPTDL
ncbi:hypothetical protein DDF65_22505 [Caulobacter radicis]|uniref:HTH tetR-type domain-containing protein n=2 Tax=Caulobacter radicis TaxID=2172650 RepID=A0A2T9IYT7_9CAUL|nr:hypothetical protein DDF65_22505 [Caulobacter radicis]